MLAMVKNLFAICIHNKYLWGKEGRKPSGEQQRRIPLPGWTDAIYVMCPE